MKVKCKSCGSRLTLSDGMLGWGITWIHEHSRGVRCDPRRKPRFIFAEGPRITDRMANGYILRHPGCAQRPALGVA